MENHFSSYSDLEIVKLCQTGDKTAFGELYERYIGKIYDFIYFKTFHKETAEDICSKTFFKALENISNFDLEQKYFSAWLYKIARNCVIDHYRKDKNHQEINSAQELHSSQNLEVDIDAKQKIEAVQKYLANFNDEQKEILTMRLWQEMNYQEISKILGKSEASCKMSFSRSIKKLRQEMPAALYIIIILNII
jgi:RNA polymerase sigma-70 factor, ECF subfamily